MPLGKLAIGTCKVPLLNFTFCLKNNCPRLLLNCICALLLANDHEIARAQYGKYEKGEDMRFSSLMKVIKALGVNPKEFFSKGFEDT